MLDLAMCSKRIGRLAEWCGDAGVDLVYLTGMKNVYYFTGFFRRPYGWLSSRFSHAAIFRDGFSFLFCSETEAVDSAGCAADKIITYRDYDIRESTAVGYERAIEPALAELRKSGGKIRRIAVDKDATPAAMADGLSRLYPAAEFADISPVLKNMMMVKDDDEVEMIRKAADLTGVCYAAARDAVREGASELDVYNACSAACVRAFGNYITFAGDFVSGENALNVGGDPTARRLANGDTMILDLWLEPYGYWADSARTFLAGDRFAEEKGEIYRLVLEALERGEKMLRPGVPAREVYSEILRFFEKKGVGEYFPVHAGHGIGLSPHEEPLLIPAGKEILRAGMVCTLEPGLYIPGKGGFRCEDIYLIREEGPMRLSVFERETLSS